MLIDVTSENDWVSIYHLCISFINPRPIALVSTVSPDGKPNLAPFSFYNMVSARPPVVIFCPGLTRDGAEKDSLVNAKATGEFVIATVTSDIAARMASCAANLPYGESEFAFSGLTPTAASRVTPALVSEAKVNIECKLREIVTTGSEAGSSSVVFGDVLVIHVADEVLDEQRRQVDPNKLRTVGRLGGQWYCDVTDPYEIKIPKRE